MALKRGFDAVVKIKVGNAWKTLATIGDITYGSSKTDISVKTRASELVRTIPGMESMPITLTVLDGTDPMDPNKFNGYQTLKHAYDNNTPVEIQILPSSTGSPIAEVDETFSVLNFEISSPVDDLKTANVSLAPTALDVATSSPSSTGGEDDGNDDSGTDGDIQTEGNP